MYPAPVARDLVGHRDREEVDLCSILRSNRWQDRCNRGREEGYEDNRAEEERKHLLVSPRRTSDERLKCQWQCRPDDKNLVDCIALLDRISRPVGIFDRDGEIRARSDRDLLLYLVV